MSTPTRPDGKPKHLLGVPFIVFTVIAASAPLTVVAGGSTTAYSVTGSNALPIGYVVLAIALAIFAVGYAAMSRYITNTGAFYSYAARGIGRPVGVGVSIVALVAYNMMQIGIYGMFGFQISSILADKLGWDVPWWVGIIVCIVIIALLGVNRVDLSAKVLAVLVAIEFIGVLVFDIVAFVSPTEGFSAEPLNPAELFTPGIGAVLAFGIAAFMGFEGAAIYGEEAKDPKRTVARATFVAVIIIGVFYAFSSWALSLAIGPDKISSGGITPEEAGPPLFFGFVDARIGTIFVDLLSILFITSLFASLLSFHNAVARYIFALGREGVLPRGLALTRKSSKAPWVGSLTQSVLALIVVVIFAILGNGSDLGPLYPVVTFFNWLTNAGAMGLVLIFAVVSLAVIGFFLGNHRDAGIWTRWIAPIISFLALGTVFVLIVVNFNVLLGVPAGDPAGYILPIIVVVPGIIGIVWGAVLKSARPATYARIGLGNPETDS